MTDNRLLVGWEGIAQFLGVSKRTMMRRREELVENGVIFYHLVGSPPRKEVAAYVSRVKDWIAEKAKKGGYI